MTGRGLVTGEGVQALGMGGSLSSPSEFSLCRSNLYRSSLC